MGNRAGRRRATWLALAVIAAAACGPKPTPSWHQETGYRWRELDVPAGEAGFTKIDGAKSGITFQNTVSDSTLLGNRILGQGAGVALGDVDGDGLVDVFLAKTEGCSALYRNLGGLRFEEITKTAGVGACDRHSSAAAFADVDGNGTLDLILLATTGPNAIFLNDGKGHFTEHRDLGLDPTGKGGTTVTMADVDGDGRLDMYVANYKAYNVDDSLPPQRRTFNQTVRQIGASKFEIMPEVRRDYKLVQRPDMGGLRMTQRAAPDDYYHNDGQHFTRVPLTSGHFLDATGKPLAEEPESFTLGARFVDLNGDGAPDLYVANDFEDTDELWFNDGHGIFRRAGWTSQRTMSNSTMGFDVADVNGDGLPDLFTVDMLANDSHRLKTQVPTHTAFPKKPGELEMQLQQQRNSLFLNRGDGTFAEAAELAGVEASGWSWGTMFMDVDLDGYQDILIANGHLWDIMDADVQERLQNRLSDVQWQRSRWQFPKLSLKNVAFRNRGDLTFENEGDKWHFGTEDDISHAMAAADLDGDGDLDVVVNRLDSPALVLRNNASAPRVAVRLTGDAPNTRAVGAKIRLLGGAVPSQEHEVIVGGLYMSHSDYEASFAMGTSDSATIIVDWRDGRRTTITGVRANRAYEIGMSTAAARPADTRSAKPLALFDDATAELRGHTHTEDAFDDSDRQFLLPNALSQLGPGVTWFDVDRDGHEDLLIGSGKGGRIALFKNSGGHLVPQAPQGPVAASDFTAVIGLAENGAANLIAGVSTWQARTALEMTGPAAVVNVPITRGSLGSTTTPVVGSHESATGPIALGDYDGDGDLDLFVGSRAIPMKYPAPASSGLFRNEGGGKFVYDTQNSLLLQNIGMVSAAVFADVNGDGHPDLLLAREWGSILLLLNDGNGHLSPAPDSWGLSRWTSRWNGITVGDLDGDGRLDIVATSWGRNTVARADSARPLFMFHGPFGAAGEEEMLLAREDTRLHATAPLNSYARVRVAMPDLVSRVGTFAAYADATLDQVLGPSAAKAEKLTAVTLDNMVFLNRGDHFEAHALPTEAQLAPAFYAGVADFDGDGFDDVFLSQNFFPTAVGTPRYDEGRSLLLLGDGKGGLKPMSGAQSGLVVYGDQRGAAYADYDGDGRLDLAVSQNGAATRLFHNRGAKPGLRVRVQGPATNPDGVGTQMRVVYGSKMGPVREIAAGSGYWSQNGAVQVLGLSATPTAVWVRWPGGGERKVPVPTGAKELLVKR
ncbi:MAG: FG-GAP-like repeat-containing protein [bacterium]